tara:strand:- start:18706 stop:19005 length:300 start_codon:yes stop_codon:yes gene_type:complete
MSLKQLTINNNIINAREVVSLSYLILSRPPLCIGKVKMNLKKMLEKDQRSGSWLARKLGVSPVAVSYWLKGIHVPRPHQKRKIARVFKCTIDYIFGDEK